MRSIKQHLSEHPPTLHKDHPPDTTTALRSAAISAGFEIRWRMFARRKSLSLPRVCFRATIASRHLTMMIIAYVPCDQMLRSETVTRICSLHRRPGSYILTKLRYDRSVGRLLSRTAGEQTTLTWIMELACVQRDIAVVKRCERSHFWREVFTWEHRLLNLLVSGVYVLRAHVLDTSDQRPWKREIEALLVTRPSDRCRLNPWISPPTYGFFSRRFGLNLH